MTKVERHMDICKGLNKIYEQKNHDYGDSFHDTFVEEGMAMARIRLSDKLNRFKKLTRMSEDRSEGFKNAPMVKDESIRDTLLDLANYAIMTVMEMDILAEEDEKSKLKDTIDELKNCVDSSCIRYTCPVCGGFMLFEKELDRYVCDNCGATYGVKASNGKPDAEETINEQQDDGSLLNKMFQIPENSIDSGKFVGPNCGNKLRYMPKLDKYICGGCGTMFSITRTAAVQRGDADAAEVE